MKKWITDAFYSYESKQYVVINDILAFFTVLSILGIILESVASLSSYTSWFLAIEYLSVAVFTAEYVARLWVVKPKRKYALSFFGIIDLLAILPSFIGLANLTFLKSARALRIMRFMRIIRLGKIARKHEKSFHESEESSHMYRMNVIIYFSALLFTAIIFGSLIYIFESHQAYAANIPLGILWAVKILVAIPPPPVDTLWGEFILVGTRFTSLVLFGLLINVVGNGVKKFLFGSEKIS